MMTVIQSVHTTSKELGFKENNVFMDALKVHLFRKKQNFNDLVGDGNKLFVINA